MITDQQKRGEPKTIFITVNKVYLISINSDFKTDCPENVEKTTVSASLVSDRVIHTHRKSLVTLIP